MNNDVDIIAVYNKRLDELYIELRKLNTERRHILEILKVLEADSYQSMTPEVTKELLEIITKNPGIDLQEIQTRLTKKYNPRHLTGRLSDMRRSGVIENRGGRGMGANWYVKES